VVIQFDDRTVMTLGPRAALKVDAFVFRPGDTNSRFHTSVLRGAFRFLSGRVAKLRPDAMKISLPVGTIGVRGTVAGGEVTGRRASVVLLDPAGAPPGGALSVSNAAGSVILRNARDGTDLRGPNLPPSPVATWSEARIQALLSVLDGRAALDDPATQGRRIALSRASCEQALDHDRRLGGDTAPDFQAQAGSGPKGPAQVAVHESWFAEYGVPLPTVGSLRGTQIARQGRILALGGQPLTANQARGLAQMCRRAFPALQ